MLQDGHIKLLHARDEDLKALDVEEIDIARQAIATLHPLAELRAEKVVPNLLCCFRWRRSKSKNDLNDSQTYELGKDEETDLQAVDARLKHIINKAGGKEYTGTDMVEDQRRIKHALHRHDTHMHAQVGKDPFNTFGYGIIAYFNLQLYLMYAYLLICAMAVFVIYSNSTGGAFAKKPNYGIS